jgi:hypothetical protein
MTVLTTRRNPCVCDDCQTLFATLVPPCVVPGCDRRVCARCTATTDSDGRCGDCMRQEQRDAGGRAT